MFCAAEILENIKAGTSNGLANFYQGGTDRNPGSGACRCVRRAMPWKDSCLDRPRCRRGQYGATGQKQILLSRVSRNGAAWCERQALRAARAACASAVCGFSFSLVRRYKRFGIASSPKNIRSKCRGVRKRPAGFCGMPRPNDPRGSRRDGGQSETRPRVKLD